MCSATAIARLIDVQSAALDHVKPFFAQSLQSFGQADLDNANRKKLTLSEYVRRRNGVPLGAPGSLRNMLRRSFGARSFAGFWQYWNPVFGYCLGRYIFVPLKRVSPPSVALVHVVYLGVCLELAFLVFTTR